MSYHLAAEASDAFVQVVPRPLQRWSEWLCDFPISNVVRRAPLLFIRVPKAGSASMSLRVYGRVLTHAPHRTALFYKRSDPAFFAKATAFAVVRHPLRRMVSAYRWIKLGGTSFAVPNAETRQAVSGITSFKQFVLDYVHPAAERGRLRQLDPVLHLQNSYVCDETGKVMVGHIFKLEDAGPLKLFLGHHGLEVPSATINRTGATPDEMPADQEVIAAMTDIYRTDIALFDYSTLDPLRPG